MERRNLDPRTRELYNMNRHSAPAIPACTRTSSRPTSLIMGPFVQPNFEGPGQYRMYPMQSGDIHHKLEDDERPLTQIELDQPSREEDADTTIVAAATPRITDHFKKLEDVGWYGSAYLLTICAFQLAFGKCYSIFSIKAVFLTAIGIFELGSLICGVAPSSNALIIGRAIAGMEG
ncbi:MAG: hypothetical protein Q9226_005735 [Calogaya cf. arnoldii]